jgi:hypothetical protein
LYRYGDFILDLPISHTAIVYRLRKVQFAYMERHLQLKYKIGIWFCADVFVHIILRAIYFSRNTPFIFHCFLFVPQKFNLLEVLKIYSRCLLDMLELNPCAHVVRFAPDNLAEALPY